MPQIIDVPPGAIKDPEIKRDFSQEGFEELKKSIATMGIINPITIVQRDKEYFLIAGRRRLLAARELQLATIPCIVIEADHEQAIATTLHENLYREDMNATDEAKIFDYLSRHLRYSNRKIVELVTKSESYVSQRLTLLMWPDKLKQALQDQKISFSVARELSMINDLHVLHDYLGFAVAQGINYRTAQKWRKDYELQNLPAPDETAGLGSLSSPPIDTITLGRCSNCKKQVPITELTPVYLCEECIQGKD
jgi:ParB family chromosome partitioning protein